MSTTLKYFLLPGMIKISRQPMEITTLLGSCVSICLWDSTLQTGGINHYLMPLWNGTGLASPKYGNIAIESLIGKMISLGSKRENLKAKVFGGASLLKSSEYSFNIGERNIEIQEAVLKDNDIELVAQSTGGKLGRKIIFNTFTGLVKMKYIKKNG